MAISRRQLLQRAGALTMAGSLPVGCADDEGEGFEDTDSGTGGGTESGTDGGDGLPQYEYDGEPGPEDLFQHGVASGDPLPDAVILWSRVTQEGTEPVEAFFEVALDPDFLERVAADYVQASPDRDFTIKVDVVGLDPATTYFYRFHALGRTSIVGRTRTAPSGPIDRLRFGVCSCSSLAHGYFHAYRHIAERPDLDVVLHLGDYIYEYGTGEYGEVRAYEPEHEIVTLQDYRTRYAQYRRDPDLQAAHQQHPFIVVWDDHEIANNGWRDGAENHQPDEGEWSERKSAGYQAFAEWVPIREPDSGEIYRAFSYGDLVDLIMLDTRYAGRDLQAEVVSDLEVIDDPARTLLGETQEAWLDEQLAASSARWRLLGQQVMFGHMRLGENTLNTDQWDGYTAARQRVFDMFAAHGVDNVVILTGDIHSSWAMEVAEDPYEGGGYDPATGEGAVAVEFVTPGITSPGFPDNLAGIGPGLMTVNPHLKWVDVQQRGYMLLDITADRLQTTWYFIADVESPDGHDQSVAAVWSVATGTNHLVEDAEPATPPDDAPPPAPTG